ncbi:hypothetical protein SAMD00019534_056280 [Acytostelium subglobosum LB1]|uniref:hypothetical protein n=1 Tax=Acytostelium subglobosum LB1 TaxID=1410327 RepID=UPI0006448529|nr:hypothetical protein SAMD00019534_056280 [Acytostelium subglobosum LB1]GAM22453.1 hypothetical protein SAMD00019534_056280 [Acytostelium subglobosum LB1]|eukprot:XP_012754573.1 hypothetical protein SAMD00019534_056280 [Acytostelium subglobosum LB1]
MTVDANGISELELERYYNPDNSIFSSSRKVVAELNAILFLVLATNLFFLVRYLYQHFILKPIAISYKVRPSYMARFLENGWYSLYYISAFVYGCYLYSQENWTLFPTINLWLGWPIQPFNTLYRTYYLLELAFYLHCTIAIFMETKRKDFYQMLTHHFATFFLVGASYWYRYHRIGLVILWLHNAGDIFLYTAKAINYLQKESKNYVMYVTSELLFVLFVIVFFMMRLVFLPSVLVRTSLFEAFYVSTTYPQFYSTNVCLIVLLFLHMFWFYLILRIIYRKMINGSVEDIRSDSEEDEPTEKSAKNNHLEAEQTSKHQGVRSKSKQQVQSKKNN